MTLSAPTVGSSSYTPPLPGLRYTDVLLIGLFEIATTMTNLTPEEIGAVVQRHPQRNIPQIILMIAVRIDNLELINWVGENHPQVINMLISNDTISVLQSMGITLP